MKHALAAVAAFVALACGPRPSPPPTSKAGVPAARPAPPPDTPTEVARTRPARPADRLAAPPSSDARPGDMLLQITAPSVDGLIAGLRGYLAQTGSPELAALDPEIRTLVRELAGSQQLELDWGQPIAAFVFGSSKSEPQMVVASYATTKPTNVDDARHLHRQGSAWLIGGVDQIDAVRGYAAKIAVAPGPVEVAVFPDAVWAGFSNEVQMLVQVIGMGLSSSQSPQAAQTLQPLIDGLIQTFRDSSRVVAQLSVDGAALDVSLALEARPNTGLARFGAGQVAATHELFEHLPAGRWNAVASGQVRLSESMARLFTELSVVEMALDTDHDDTDIDELGRQLWDVFAGRAGRFAWAGELKKGGSELLELIELRDTKGAAALIEKFDELTGAGWKASQNLVRKVERPRTVAGVTVRAMTVRAKNDKRAKPWWFRYGLAGGYVFGAGGASSSRNARQLIAAARRAAAKKPAPRSKPPAGLVAAFADSKTRRENMVAWLDVAGLAAYMGKPVDAARARKSSESGLTVGLTATPAASRFRVTVPADQLGLLAGLDP